MHFEPDVCLQVNIFPCTIDFLCAFGSLFIPEINKSIVGPFRLCFPPGVNYNRFVEMIIISDGYFYVYYSYKHRFLILDQNGL